MTLLVATCNPGKKREFQHLLTPLKTAFRFPSDLDLIIDVPEDGTTYAENASQKALTYMRASGLLTLADDSGLEVDALNGAPGVRSARYASGQDIDRIEMLLEAMHGIPEEKRSARFRCIVAIATLNGEIHTTEGVCEGRITFEPMGQGGFGYDPIFYLPNRGQTMAQIPEAEKNRISHRAQAVKAALPLIYRLLS